MCLLDCSTDFYSQENPHFGKLSGSPERIPRYQCSLLFLYIKGTFHDLRPTLRFENKNAACLKVVLLPLWWCCSLRKERQQLPLMVWACTAFHLLVRSSFCWWQEKNLLGRELPLQLELDAWRCLSHLWLVGMGIAVPLPCPMKGTRVHCWFSGAY